MQVKKALFSFIFKADESKVLAENIEVERQKFEASSKEITKLQEAVRKAEAKSVFSSDSVGFLGKDDNLSPLPGMSYEKGRHSTNDLHFTDYTAVSASILVIKINIILTLQLYSFKGIIFGLGLTRKVVKVCLNVKFTSFYWLLQIFY
jgi:hypothetical protein